MKLTLRDLWVFLDSEREELMESGKNQITEAGSLGHGDMIHVKLPGGSWWPAQVCELHDSP